MDNYLIFWISVDALLFSVSLVLIIKRWNSLKDIIGSQALKGKVFESRMDGRSNTTSNFKVRYEYIINGNRYTNKLDSTLVTDFQGFIEKNPIGSSIDIYVSENNPKLSMTVPPTRGETFFFVIKPFILLLVTVNIGFLYLL